MPKLGWLRYRNSRGVLGEVRQVTVSANGGRWFVSIQTEREVEQPMPQATTAIGIDVGIARFATFSDGAFLAPLHSFKKHEQRLKRTQRAMSRKQKFSHNWKKAKARVQRIHARIGNARRDTLHKATSTISQNHAFVCIEDLQVRNMSKSAAGTIEKPGKNDRVKSGLNKSILDQGWFEFRRQLGYKLQWNGGMLIAVPPQDTSRTCPCCGHWRAGAARPPDEAGTHRSGSFRPCACNGRRRNQRAAVLGTYFSVVRPSTEFVRLASIRCTVFEFQTLIVVEQPNKAHPPDFADDFEVARTWPTRIRTNKVDGVFPSMQIRRDVDAHDLVLATPVRTIIVKISERHPIGASIEMACLNAPAPIFIARNDRLYASIPHVPIAVARHALIGQLAVDPNLPIVIDLILSDDELFGGPVQGQRIVAGFRRPRRCNRKVGNRIIRIFEDFSHFWGIAPAALFRLRLWRRSALIGVLGVDSDDIPDRAAARLQFVQALLAAVDGVGLEHHGIADNAGIRPGDGIGEFGTRFEGGFRGIRRGGGAACVDAVDHPGNR
jgi:IS605 OrfB family transposase